MESLRSDLEEPESLKLWYLEVGAMLKATDEIPLYRGYSAKPGDTLEVLKNNTEVGRIILKAKTGNARNFRQIINYSELENKLKLV